MHHKHNKLETLSSQALQCRLSALLTYQKYAMQFIMSITEHSPVPNGLLLL